MAEELKGCKLSLDKGVLRLEVNMLQPYGKLLTYGALEWAKENVEGWFLQQEMILAQAREAKQIIKPVVIRPTNGDAS